MNAFEAARERVNGLIVRQMAASAGYGVRPVFDEEIIRALDEEHAAFEAEARDEEPAPLMEVAA